MSILSAQPWLTTPFASCHASAQGLPYDLERKEREIFVQVTAKLLTERWVKRLAKRNFAMYIWMALLGSAALAWEMGSWHTGCKLRRNYSPQMTDLRLFSPLNVILYLTERRLLLSICSASAFAAFLKNTRPLCCLMDNQKRSLSAKIERGRNGESGI